MPRRLSTSPYRLFSTFLPCGNWFTALLHIFCEIFSCRCLLSSSSMTRLLSSIVVGAPRAQQPQVKSRSLDIVCDSTSAHTHTSCMRRHIYIQLTWNFIYLIFMFSVWTRKEVKEDERRIVLRDCVKRMKNRSENIVQKSKNSVRVACRPLNTQKSIICLVTLHKSTESNVNIFNSVLAPRLYKLILKP